MTVQQNTFTLPIGPQHPALKEPGHFLFTVDGEVVTRASVRLGYAHRGIEKATESRTWTQNLYLLERICGICSHIHAFAYSLAVETLAEVEVPPRAEAIRTIIAELERIHSHLLWLGVTAHEAGFDTLFMYSWRDREVVLELLEQLTGNRVHYSANTLGGVKCDITAEHASTIHDGLGFLKQRTQHYLHVIETDLLLQRRTRGIGVMTRNQAAQLGVVGPTARASGVSRDLRVDAPYAAYISHPVTPVLDTAGDLHARITVRLRELFESYRLIDTLLATLPTGALQTRMPRRIPAGEAIVRVEAPRGELFYFVASDGGDKPCRVHVRTPTLCNMASVLTLVVGHQLADVPMILVGIDPCFSCNDRSVELVDQVAHLRWTWDDLRRYGISHYESVPLCHI